MHITKLFLISRAFTQLYLYTDLIYVNTKCVHGNFVYENFARERAEEMNPQTQILR